MYCQVSNNVLPLLIFHAFSNKSMLNSKRLFHTTNFKNISTTSPTFRQSKLPNQLYFIKMKRYWANARETTLQPRENEGKYNGSDYS